MGRETIVMRIYPGIKYHCDNKNKDLIEALCFHLEKQGHAVSCIVRDFENWGQKSFTPAELMTKTFEMIDRSDVITTNSRVSEPQ
jgi:hypothetical protein